MKLTTNTILHFTNNLEKLENILCNKFKMFYCSEDFNLDKETLSLNIPMLCFSDIPLKHAINQINAYGSYGIGMRKKWAVNNKLNPVIYLESKSDISNKLLEQFNRLVESIKNARSEAENSINKLNINESLNKTEIALTFYDNLAYVKNYEGLLKRRERDVENYRFYDEREWRITPSLTQDVIISDENYKKYRDEQSEKKPWALSPLFSFDSDDIAYLIIKDNDERSKLIEIIDRSGILKNLSQEQKFLFFNKVISVEDLENIYW